MPVYQSPICVFEIVNPVQSSLISMPSLVYTSSIRDESSAGVSNEEVMKFLREVKNELKSHNARQLKSLEAELGKSVDNFHKSVKELIETVKKNNWPPQEKFVIQVKVKALEQESNQEGFTVIIKTIRTVLRVQAFTEDIEVCLSLGPKHEGRRTGNIVKFVRRELKEEMLRTRKI
ncbi:hypothetical protein J6590_028031 [Homalodisca vitripennis]|nr:hypothetical protein J6590_028031 [Homalodisca vitripennis]